MFSKIVGILNLSPDSFSDGCNYSRKYLEQRIEKLIADGADIIDVGAESTAPGSLSVSEAEELRRLKDFFAILETQKFRDISFSMDTKKSHVAQQAIKRGVQTINDVSAGRSDHKMYDLIVSHPAVKYIVMYSKNITGHAQKDHEPLHEDILTVVINFFDTLIPQLMSKGIRKEQIIIDPGMGGFISGDFHDSIRILQSISVIQKKYKLPIHIGTSKKGFLAKISPDTGTDDRVISSIVSSLFAGQKGAEYLRVHNVYEMRQALSMWQALNL